MLSIQHNKMTEEQQPSHKATVQKPQLDILCTVYTYIYMYKYVQLCRKMILSRVGVSLNTGGDLGACPSGNIEIF